MILEHNFFGAIDTDSPDHEIDPRWVRDARNVIWRGSQGKMRAESVVGTTIIPNPFLPTAGVNLCILACYDDVNQQLYDFNFNSAGTSGIYIYDTVSAIWLTLIQVGINTGGDPLGFTTKRIQGAKFIYGDPVDGDLLFFLNSNGVPSKINVQRFLNTPYTPIVRPYLDVIKAPPHRPPWAIYENDTTVNANNLVNSLFQFAYTWLYDDFEESVISSGSITPLPSIPFTNTLNIDKSKCARMAVYLETGPKNVTKIRIYMRQTQNGPTSGWYIVDTISKAGNGILDNGVYRFVFFNSGNYIPADPKFTVLLQDDVPQKAGCMELLNGDTLAYAAITEGYDWFKSQFSFALTFNSNEDVDYIINGTLFFADYNGGSTAGQPNIEIFLTGEGVNDPITGLPITITSPPQNYYVNAKSSGTDISFNTFTAGAQGIPQILSEIATSAVSAGWTLVQTKPNSIVITYPTGTVILQSTRIENRFLDVNNPNTQLAIPAQSSSAVGVVYYDTNGRTNGVITDVTASFNTFPYNIASDVTITNVQVNLNGVTPPTWASYYHLVKTLNLTYSNQLYWVSNQAFSNVGQLVSVQYAYIGITNIADYNLAIQATQGVVGYEFKQGDRIRFIGRYTFNGMLTPLNFDYAVLGVATNPIINGTEQLGNFVQIAYPTADIGPNFKFDGTADFNDYFIQLYSIASNSTLNTSVNAGSTSDQGNVFYEFGQMYFIGNPGSNMAYHMGNLADNQVIFNDGDSFARQRTVPTGNTYYLTGSAAAFSNRYVTPHMVPNLAPTIVTPYYTINTQDSSSADPTNPGVYPRLADGGGMFTNTSGAPINIRLRTTIQANPDGATWMDVAVKIDLLGGSSTTTPFLITHSDGIPNVTSTDIEVDGTVMVPDGAKAWFLLGNGEQVENLNTNGYLLRLDIVTQVTINIFEPSFSDVYNLVTSNNSRAIVQNTLAKSTFYSTLFRYSLNYQVGTTINNTNRFYQNNFDEFDKSHGDVVRMRARQRELRIFQKRRCGHVGVYAKFIKDNAGVNTLVTTDDIITSNNIEYFEGEYGIGNQPDSLCSSGLQDYFVDPVRGFWLRVSQDGVSPISEEFKIQTFAGENLPNYLSDYAYAFGGNAVILGAYNFTSDRPSEALFVLQGGVSGVNGTLIGQSVAFKELGNAWTSFYDFAPDAIVCCENTLFSFSNGVLYSHTNTNAYCNFYGNQFAPSIAIVKNELAAVDKTWIGISEVASEPWLSPLIYTDSMSYPGQRQESNMVAGDFSLVEAHYKASLLNDIHSIGGIGNGQRLKGSLIYFQLTVPGGSQFAFLSHIALKANVSQLVQK